MDKLLSNFNHISAEMQGALNKMMQAKRVMASSSQSLSQTCIILRDTIQQQQNELSFLRRHDFDLEVENLSLTSIIADDEDELRKARQRVASLRQDEYRRNTSRVADPIQGAIDPPVDSSDDMDFSPQAGMSTVEDFSPSPALIQDNAIVHIPPQDDVDGHFQDQVSECPGDNDGPSSPAVPTVQEEDNVEPPTGGPSTQSSTA